MAWYSGLGEPMYASNRERGTNMILRSCTVSEVMVTTFIWGHSGMGVSKGNIYTTFVSSTCWHSVLPHPMEV